MVPALDDVLDALARAVVPAGTATTRVGDVELRPHQVHAVAQVRAAIAEFGGALLADDPGLGKTFVALAVAAGYPRRIVAAPASLRGMWRDAAVRARVPVEFTSFEALSRGRMPSPAPFLIVDEAHRTATRTAWRYARVARLAHHARVLLLTATPVRNRRSELEALLALFLGPEAACADDTVVARCVVRRTREVTGAQLPVRRAHRVWRRGGDEMVAAMLRSLPPPLALSDGAGATGLVATSLARCCASSAAALDRALVRRLQRGAAISAMLDAGRVPDRAALTAWVVGDDAMQLAFPFLADEAGARDLDGMRVSLAHHLDAVESLRATAAPLVAPDTAWRASRLQAVLRRHRGAIVIAFTTFEATATAVFSSLQRHPGVVLLTGDAARSGAGAIAREEILNALGAEPVDRRPSPRLALRLVIATDLLSEGVNLQTASVIVHLDDPWTPAAVAQRVGRAARLGSAHALVHTYRFAPGRATASLIRLAARYRTKAEAARRALDPGAAAESLRAAVTPWLGRPAAYRASVVAAARSSHHGFLARIDSDAQALIVGGCANGARRWAVSDDLRRVLRLVRSVARHPLPAPRPDEVMAATKAALRWAMNRAARQETRAAAPASRVRRCVIARLDAHIAQLRSAERAAIVERISTLRACLSAARGAGLELALASLLARPETDDAWICDLERLVGQPDRGALARTAQPEVVALLFLQRDAATAPAAPAPSRAPPAASTETAAPR